VRQSRFHLRCFMPSYDNDFANAYGKDRFQNMSGQREVGQFLQHFG